MKTKFFSYGLLVASLYILVKSIRNFTWDKGIIEFLKQNATLISIVIVAILLLFLAISKNKTNRIKIKSIMDSSLFILPYIRIRNSMYFVVFKIVEDGEEELISIREEFTTVNRNLKEDESPYLKETAGRYLLYLPWTAEIEFFEFCDKESKREFDL